MASKFPEAREEMAQLRPRKGHDMAWSCDKHAEPISFHCVEHNLYICLRCAFKEHQRPCNVDDLEDVISEVKRKLDGKLQDIEETKKRLERLGCEIQSCATSANNHLQLVNDEVNATYEGKLKSVTYTERDDVRLINEEADEEIRIINENRDKRIKACNEEAEQQQLIIKESQTKLLDDNKTISGMVAKYMDDLKLKNQQHLCLMDSIVSKMKRIKQDDKTLLNEAPQVISSLDESLIDAIAHYRVGDYLDLIQSKVKRVKFVEAKIGGKDYARIDGYIGKWEFVKSIPIPLIVNYPLVPGLIGNDEICVRDLVRKDAYITNIKTERTEKVIEGDSNMYITSCAPIDCKLISCGKWRRDCKGDILDGSITLYDRQGKVIRDITIPRNTSSMLNTVHVDVYQDEMVVAAENGQSNIYVINHVDGKIVNTITMQGERVCSGIQALSSGDFVVKTRDNELTVISRSGEEKAVIHCDEWDSPSCYVDKLTDMLYVTYWDRKRHIFAVDQVSRDGNIQASRIVEYLKSNRFYYISPCITTPSGNLVACDGEKLFVYKKNFIV